MQLSFIPLKNLTLCHILLAAGVGLIYTYPYVHSDRGDKFQLRVSSICKKLLLLFHSFENFFPLESG